MSQRASKNGASRRRAIAAAAACAAVALLATISAPASAGTYTVYSCRTPDGAAAPTSDWVFSGKRSTSGRLTNACPSGPLSFELTPNASHAPDDETRLVFPAPPDTEIRGYAIYRSARLGPRYNYWRWDLGVGDGVVERCHTTEGTCSQLGNPAQPFGAPNLLRAADRVGVKGIQFKLTCGEDDTKTTSCVAANPAGIVNIHRAEVTLLDSYSPRFEGAPSGTLVDPGAQLIGVQQAWIEASDRGSGVYRALAEVDGQIAATTQLDANDGRCQEPFTAAKPCASRTAGALSLDTAQLADGPHDLRILLTDATGTNTAEWGPVRITTANGSCSPTPRSDAMHLSAGVPQRARKGGSSLRTAVRRRYGQAVELRGRLTTMGAPVGGARVCIGGREARSGASLRTYGSVTTDADGRFVFKAPGGPARELVAVHRTAGGAVVGKVRVAVAARPSLAPSRGRLRNGETVILGGRLLHGPIPRRGVLVELQAQRGPHTWQTFGTARTNRRGRYRYPYRFTRTTGVQRYTMRAFVAQQPVYPYNDGASRPIAVTVGP